MKSRIIATIGVAVVSVGLLGACGSGSEEEETSAAATEPEDQEPEEESVELDPEKMTGSLNQEQTVAFVEYAAEKHEIDVCEHVTAALDPDDLNGVVNLLMDRGGGYAQDIEKLSTMGVSVYARDACDY